MLLFITKTCNFNAVYVYVFNTVYVQCMAIYATFSVIWIFDGYSYLLCMQVHTPCVVIAAYAVCMWTDVLSLTMHDWGNHSGYSRAIWLDIYVWTSDYSFMHNGSCLYCMIPNKVISHWRTWLTNNLVLSPALSHCHQFPDPVANSHTAVMRL